MQGRNIAVVIVIVVAVVVLFALLFGFAGWGMMGPGFFGPGVMGPGMMGWGGFGFNPLWSILMLLFWLLIIGGVVALVIWLLQQGRPADTGVHAFELLIDKYTGAVVPEMGPNMFWNTKYGMGGGMMGRQFRGGTAADMPITPDGAEELARRYLQTQTLDLDVETPDRFYGYYTLHTLRGGEVEGMLSVNGFTGEIWYHAWHGPFIQETPAGGGG